MCVIYNSIFKVKNIGGKDYTSSSKQGLFLVREGEGISRSLALPVMLYFLKRERTTKKGNEI